ncbi:hyaluronan and proteoglycan link protein 1-like [Xenentodon cancila]
MMSLLFTIVISLTLAGSAYCEMASPSSVMTVTAELGSNATLPCKLLSQESFFLGSLGLRINWLKVADDESFSEDVLSSMAFHKRTYGRFVDRVFLSDPNSDDDASIVIQDVSMEDMGKYQCEIVSGEDDTVQEIILKVVHGLTKGVVFPYFPRRGRYNLNFSSAIEACRKQDAVIASHDQLHEAWQDGLDWCNAGWLSDGSVQYPITKPRQPCGGSSNRPGLRSYGHQDKRMSRFDVFCYASELKGHFYWLVQPERLTFHEAVQACLDDNAEIAKVGQMYSAWKLEGYDRCDAGWLADGSVRYPISRPRKNCSPTEAAVRFVGFTDKNQKSYGVYCFKADE